MQRFLAPSAVALAVGLLAAPAPAQGALWIVDDGGGPGVDATDIQPAIDAAADGDVLLVKSGLYSSFTLDGRSLAVIGEDGGDVQIGPGTVTVKNLAAGQAVVLRGFDAISAGFFFPPVSFTDCAGSIRVEDCGLRTNNSGEPDAIRVASCAAISFLRCSTIPSQGTPSGAALVAVDSHVAVWDSGMLGRAGAVGGGDGGSGIVASGGSLFVSGGETRGGDGGKGLIFTVGGVQHCTNGGDGGNGLVLSGAPGSARLLDTALAAGLGGAGALTCSSGADGAEVVAEPGVLTTLAGSARSFHSEALVCDRHDVLLHAHGLPRELLMLAVSAAPAFAPSATWKGVLLLDAPWTVPLGALDAAGDLAVALYVPQLPAAAPEATLLGLQAVFAGGEAHAVLGPASALAVITTAACP